MSIDPFDLVVSFISRDDYRIFKVKLEQLTEAERNVRLVWELDGQVCNGGFMQYFTNPSGEHTPLAVDAFVSIGAGKAATIVEAAIAHMPAELDWTDHQRRIDNFDEVSKEVWDAVDALDTRYYGLRDSVFELLADYIQTRPLEFDLGVMH